MFDFDEFGDGVGDLVGVDEYDPEQLGDGGGDFVGVGVRELVELGEGIGDFVGVCILEQLGEGSGDFVGIGDGVSGIEVAKVDGFGLSEPEQVGDALVVGCGVCVDVDEGFGDIM